MNHPLHILRTMAPTLTRFVVAAARQLDAAVAQVAVAVAATAALRRELDDLTAKLKSSQFECAILKGKLETARSANAWLICKGFQIGLPRSRFVEDSRRAKFTVAQLDIGFTLTSPRETIPIETVNPGERMAVDYEWDRDMIHRYRNTMAIREGVVDAISEALTPLVAVAVLQIEDAEAGADAASRLRRWLSERPAGI